ncbi:hypothetical protein KC349_g6081 [Hortaea werneckii]|nr:hypothetical protein KC349_g6081 [Hortaea werneckii]
MAFLASSFPIISDGDVLMALSDKTTDVVQLHISILANCSKLFETSLTSENWVRNKSFVSDSGVSLKLLELAFDDHDLLPTLVGRTTRASAQEFRQLIDSYDEQIESQEQEPEESNAYAMLPKFAIKIHHLLFSRDLGYRLIAECPYSMFRASCKLRSQVVYKEAMRHAVGLHAYTLELMEDAKANSRPIVFDYFAENNEPGLQEAFDGHVRVLRGIS